MCKIMEDYGNKRYDQGANQRGEACANNMFIDNEPISKIIRYSGLSPERVHEIGVAGGYIKE